MQFPLKSPPILLATVMVGTDLGHKYTRDTLEKIIRSIQIYIE
jgi:hypothetical protein